MILEMNFKKLAILHIFTTSIFGVFAVLINSYFGISYIPFYAGLLIGSVLPDIDHLIYIYFLKPHELTSQRATNLINNNNYIRAFDLISETHNERTLIFHNVYFQVFFMILTLFVVTSTNSLLGIGLVFSFSLHFIVDLLIFSHNDYLINQWFRNFPINIDRKKVAIYTVLMLIILLFLAIYI